MKRVRVLLSGGIGAGKSEVGRLLSARGARVIDADRVGHRVLEEDARAEVAARWPEAVVAGTVDRNRLGRIVFDDPAELRALEEITHPHIRRRIREELERASEEVVVVEVPLMEDFLGEGWERVVVDAPDEVRMERLRTRGMREEAIRRRMAAQPDRSAWREWADQVVDNAGDREHLAREVDRLWGRLVGLDGPSSPVH